MVKHPYYLTLLLSRVTILDELDQKLVAVLHAPGKLKQADIFTQK